MMTMMTMMKEVVSLNPLTQTCSPFQEDQWIKAELRCTWHHTVLTWEDKPSVSETSCGGVEQKNDYIRAFSSHSHALDRNPSHSLAHSLTHTHLTTLQLLSVENSYEGDERRTHPLCYVDTGWSRDRTRHTKSLFAVVPGATAAGQQ